MIYSFVTDSDLDIGMKKYFREQITEFQAKMNIQKLAEGAAFSLIKTKLNNRYDLLAMFPLIKEWDKETAFLLGEYCSHKDIIYKSIQAGTAHDPCTEASTYWKQSDPRDPLLVMYCAVLTIYHMLKSVAPRKITDEFHNEYVDVLEWLDRVKEGEENPDYPLKDNGSSTIQWGSQEPNEHYY